MIPRLVGLALALSPAEAHCDAEPAEERTTHVLDKSTVRDGRLHAPGDDGTTLCGLRAADLGPDEGITEPESNDANCAKCSEIEDREWRETMREVFGSPAGMSPEEFEVMGDIWDDAEEPYDR